MRDKTALKLWLHLARTSARVQSAVNARLREKYGQSMARFDVLSQLARAEGQALRSRDLSQALIAAPANISRLLDRMQKEGLLQRTPSARDRRSVMVMLTPAGAALFARMAEDHERWISVYFDAVPETHQRALLKGLLDLQSRMGPGLSRTCQARSATAV